MAKLQNRETAALVLTLVLLSITEKSTLIGGCGSKQLYNYVLPDTPLDPIARPSESES